MIAPDVGGGFGSKLTSTPRSSSRSRSRGKLGRPVKWTEERSEDYLATIHGRDVIQEIELAATAEGKITGVRDAPDCRDGRVPAARHARHAAARRLAVRGVLRRRGATTSTARASSRTRRRPTPTAAPAGPRRPTRSSGRWTRWPRKLGKDPVELRRLNFITEFPATIASGLTIDSGDYDASLDRALELVGYESVRAEQAAAAGRAATRSSSASASRPTSRCAGSRRRGSSARSATARAAGSDRRSAACRPAPSR